jgi:hypothetical protein
MKASYLFPHRFSLLGWLLAIPAATFGLLMLFGVLDGDFLGRAQVFAIYAQRFLSDDIYFGFVTTDLADELISLLFTIGLLLIAFSAEREEDEFIRHLRLESLVWATKVNYLILIFFILFLYEGGFLLGLVFNMFTLLILLILRFRISLYMTWRAGQ